MELIKNALVLWPHVYESWQASNVLTDDGYTQDEWKAITERSLKVVKSDWSYTRVLKATAADQKKRCEECIYGKQEIGESFEKGDTVVREQTSQCTWQTMHLECSLSKLLKIRDEIDKGISEFKTIMRDENNDDE